MWKEFVDKEVYGITFRMPEGWSADAQKGTQDNTVGDTLTLYSSKEKKEESKVFEMVQVVAIPDSECSKICSIDRVGILDKVITLDTSGGSNDKKIPVNPRLSETGVDGHLQLRISNDYVQNPTNVETLRKVLETLKYN